VVDDRRIRGVLFDSGDVLIRPIGGRWNPRYDFEDIVLAHHPGSPVERFPEAFAVGQRVLGAGTTTANRTDYHRAMLAVLGIDAPSAALLGELEAPAAGPVVEVFPDVRPVLEQLRAWGVGMAVVSDNWAGLEDGYRSSTERRRRARARPVDRAVPRARCRVAGAGGGHRDRSRPGTAPPPSGP
jgi:hypothetical protein